MPKIRDHEVVAPKIALKSDFLAFLPKSPLKKGSIFAKSGEQSLPHRKKSLIFASQKSEGFLGYKIPNRSPIRATVGAQNWPFTGPIWALSNPKISPYRPIFGRKLT